MSENSKYMATYRAKQHFLRDTDEYQTLDELNALDRFLRRAWDMGWLAEYDPDYRGRMKHEYRELKERYEKLQKACENNKKGLIICPTDDIEVMSDQLAAMEKYMRCLENRAKNDGFDL